MQYPERALHTAIVNYLNYAIGGAAFWTTFPAGGGGRLRGAMLRGMGLKPGVPDILIIDAGRALWLEVKAVRGTLSREQKECHDALRLARSDVAVVRSLEEVESALERWGVPLKAKLTGGLQCKIRQ